MERGMKYLLVTLACLMMRASARDCTECWRDVCSAGFNIDENFSDDCCNCVEELPTCPIAAYNASTSPDCCSVARDSILSVLSNQSGPNNVCNTSISPSYPFMDPDDLKAIPLRTLSAGEYVVPYFHFQCRGCVDEVLVQALIPDFVPPKPDNPVPNPITVTMNFMIWSRLVDDQDEALYTLRYNVTEIVTETGIDTESPDVNQLTLNFSLPEGNKLCFNEGEVFGLSFGSTPELKVILARPDPSSGSTYSLTPEDDTCPQLNEFRGATSVEDDGRIPLMAIRIRPPRPTSSVNPPTSSVTQPTSSIPTPSRGVTSTGSSVANTAPLPTPSLPPVVITTADSQVSFPPSLVIAISGGSVGVLAVVVGVVLTVVIMQRRNRRTDKVDGTGTGGEINRVRSMNMERRLQENSQIQALPMNAVTYDYPTTQVHPYHVLEAPSTEHNSLGNYTTMQPAGSVQEGAITPMGHSSHTIRSIYDDDVTSGEHRDPEYDAPNLPPRPVHNTPFYHVLEAPGQINGQPVAQVGYDDPVELLHERQGSKEEIVNPIYNEVKPRPLPNPQMFDPASTHSYHVLENPAQQQTGENSEAETVEEHGLYVPTAEERRRILNNPSKTTSDLHNWIKKNRAESTKKRKFFESTSTYWKPPSDADSLYNTLARRKYREILSDQIQIVKYIGSGQFGTVNLAVWKQQYVEPMEVAVKVCRAGKNEAIKTKFLKEAAVMGQFRHPNVVKLYGVVTMSELPMIVLELLKNGDLLDYMNKNFEPGRLPPPSPTRLHSFSLQVACGMEYLSSKSFVHRDLAARNILLNELHQCKIGDFGMARDLEDSEYYIMSRKGPLPFKWTAPEALNYRKYSTFSDCYSYGMVLYEIWSVGREPLPGIKIKEIPDLVSKGFCQAPPPGCPRAIYELMVKLWNPNKRHRPTFPQIVQYLRQPEEQVLGWSEEDRGVSSQASVLGAPLEEGKNLYPTLQNAYQSSWC